MSIFFFYNDTDPPEISPLPHPAVLPTTRPAANGVTGARGARRTGGFAATGVEPGPHHIPYPGSMHEVHRHLSIDRKSTRLNSSHANISYAVFCLKKK